MSIKITAKKFCNIKTDWLERQCDIKNNRTLESLGCGRRKCRVATVKEFAATHGVSKRTVERIAKCQDYRAYKQLLARDTARKRQKQGTQTDFSDGKWTDKRGHQHVILICSPEEPEKSPAFIALCVAVFLLIVAVAFLGGAK